MKILQRGLRFPEGPVAMEDGSVIFCEIHGGVVQRHWPDGRMTLVAETGGGPNGLALGPDGAIYVCNHGGKKETTGYNGGSIQRIDLATGKVTTLYTHIGEYKLSSPNDLVFDEHGGFYFTDMGKKHERHRDYGGVYYALPDGSSIVEVAYPVITANGICLSPDNTILYLAETDTGRLWSFDILSPGVVRKEGLPSIHGGRCVHGLGGYQKLDGLAVTESGNICMATLVTGYVHVISPDGRLLRSVDTPGEYTTNLCFGGPDRRTAYITLSHLGQLIEMPWDETGLVLNYGFKGTTK